MKLLVTEPLQLPDGRTAKPGEVIEASPELAWTYVRQGKAKQRPEREPKETKTK